MKRSYSSNSRGDILCPRAKASTGEVGGTFIFQGMSRRDLENQCSGSFCLSQVDHSAFKKMLSMLIRFVYFLLICVDFPST